MSGTLSMIATPIGNLEDITLRALRVLKEADVVLCEDTRVTGKLLKHYEIDAKLMRCDAEKEQECAEVVVELLEAEKHVALVSDAGTPGISDPGARLVRYVRTYVPDISIEAIPGPSSLTAALSVSGIPADTFTFLGFVPHKKGRKTFFEGLAAFDHPVVFFESPHRIMKTLEALREQEGSDRTVTVVREITKLYEEVATGTPEEVLAHFDQNKDRVKGEFVVIVS